jgi:hypothetical protein
MFKNKILIFFLKRFFENHYGTILVFDFVVKRGGAGLCLNKWLFQLCVIQGNERIFLHSCDGVAGVSDSHVGILFK